MRTKEAQKVFVLNYAYMPETKHVLKNHEREILQIFGYAHVSLTRLLVFSKCFRAGFGAFSTFKFKVIEGTN